MYVYVAPNWLEPQSPAFAAEKVSLIQPVPHYICGRCGRDRGGQYVGLSSAVLSRVDTNSFVFIMIYDIDSQAVNDLSVGVQAGASDSGTGSGECSSRSPALVTRRLGHKGWKLKNVPLTRVDLHFRKIEDRLLRQIALSERTPEQVLSARYWWKRFSLFLIDRLVSVTRSKLFKARRGWFILASRYHRRLHEATCFKAAHSVIRMCAEAGYWVPKNPAFWPHRRACNRCLVCVANYISSRDCVDRKKLLSRACHLWQDLPSQQYSLVDHVVRTHGDLGNARFCPGCNKLCASENGVFMHSAFCKTLGRALKTMVDVAGAYVWVW